LGGERRQLLADASIVNKRARPHPTARRVRARFIPESCPSSLPSLVQAADGVSECRCGHAFPGELAAAPRDMLLPDRKGLPVTTSKTIAGLIRPTLVAIAAAMLFNFGSFPALAEQISRDPGLIFVSGILLFVAGLAIVRAHNIWTGGWPVLVTVLGWLTVLGGLLRMLFPTQLAAMVARVDQSSGRIIVGAGILLVLGPFSHSKGYSRD
jgi:hypothetical protein